MAALCLNLTLCSLVRLPRTVRASRQLLDKAKAAPVDQPFAGDQVQRLSEYLTRNHYRCSEADGRRIFTKNLIGFYGSFLTHLSFLLILIVGVLAVVTADVSDQTGMPVAFLVLSYAAFQPMEIKELMPALRSTWFALHIASATFSYASFAISGGLGVHYLLRLKKGRAETENRMVQTDYNLPADLPGLPAADGCHSFRRDLGRAGMVPLVELGSQGNLDADHLDPVCYFPAPAHPHEVAGQAHGMVCSDRGDLRAVQLCRGEQAAARTALLCGIIT